MSMMLGLITELIGTIRMVDQMIISEVFPGMMAAAISIAELGIQQTMLDNVTRNI